MNENSQPERQSIRLFLLLLFSLLFFAPVVAMGAAPGCSADVVITTEGAGVGFNPTDYELSLASYGDAASGKYEGTFALDMGQQTINPNAIIIPFEQEVCVSFVYEGDGDVGSTPTLGWLLAEDAVLDNAGVLDWDAIPDTAKHPIFENVSDGVTPRDTPVCLGTFSAGTELVFWLANDSGDWSAARPNSTEIFFTKSSWNPDAFSACSLADDPHTREFLLDQASAGEVCVDSSRGLLDTSALSRLSSEFSLNLSGTYGMTVYDGEQFDHGIVVAADGDPNQWILSWEETTDGGDMDFNDVTFLIEREHGGSVTMKPKRPHEIDSSVATNAFYTAVTFGVYDEIPACSGNQIDYSVSIDNGLSWMDITAWDTVDSYTLNDDGTKTPGATVVGWTPGAPPFTYREARIDFLGNNLSGQELVWRAELHSNSTDAVCTPRIIDTTLNASTASPQVDISRSSPVMVGNVLFSGSFRPPDVGDTTSRPRGYIRASEIYDPSDPGTANNPPLLLWEGGDELANSAALDRNIYLPDISAQTVVVDPLVLTLPDGTTTADRGDGTTLTYTGTLPDAPVLATTVRIFAGTKEFRDEGPGVLVGDSGDYAPGKINRIDRFSGEFTITFDSAQVPSNLETFRAEYAYYSAPATDNVQPLYNSGQVTDALLGLDARQINGSYAYDFNADTLFTDDDRAFLVEWIHGVGLPWKLGAIDHSVPAVMVPPGKPNWYYGTGTSSDARVSYNRFTDEHVNRRTSLFVGSRSGMLHAFDAGSFLWGDNPETSLPLKEKRGYFAWYDHDNNPGSPKIPDYGTGEELWAFIPANLLPRLKNNFLNQTSLEGDQAFVDASPTLTDVRLDMDCPGGCDSVDCISGELQGELGSEQCVGEWRSVLLSAQGNGGDSIFCLDVTDPSSPKFLWEYADPELFRSRSSPAVGKVGRLQVSGEEKWAAFFVSGKAYNANAFPSIYIIDIADGSLINRVILDANLVSDPVPNPGLGGVPSGQPAIVDTDGNGYVDRLYVGTDKGFLYKVNLPDDPAAYWSDVNNVIVNQDFSAGELEAMVNGQPNPVPDEQRWHPIYASPTVMVEHKINPNGSISYETRIFFGTGDNPYFDENIDTANTVYHFFSYVDRAPKGSVNYDQSVDPYQVELDWFFPLDSGQRVFASAFVSAGKVYFGTATSETEDPCGGPNLGELYAFDVSGYDVDSPVQPSTRIVTGDITTTPLVEDEHLFIRNSNGTIMVGGGGFNNETKVRGFGKTRPMIWRELTD